MQVVISKKAEKSNAQATSNPIYISKIQVKMISNIIFFSGSGFNSFGYLQVGQIHDPLHWGNINQIMLNIFL